ncbi:hypothetical protein MKX01_007999, partial [Papaver californicum]
MAEFGTKFSHGFVGLVLAFVLVFVFVTGKRNLEDEANEIRVGSDYFTSLTNFLWNANVGSVYEHVWP